jgi:hypothetical protein
MAARNAHPADRKVMRLVTVRQPPTVTPSTHGRCIRSPTSNPPGPGEARRASTQPAPQDVAAQGAVRRPPTPAHQLLDRTPIGLAPGSRPPVATSRSTEQRLVRAATTTAIPLPPSSSSPPAVGRGRHPDSGIRPIVLLRRTHKPCNGHTRPVDMAEMTSGSPAAHGRADRLAAGSSAHRSFVTSPHPA